MAAPTTAYGERLRAAIDTAGLSVREVAKRLAERTGNQLADERSSIYRYLKTQVPSPERAAHLALILDDPALGDVTPVGVRRQGRLAVLQEEVDELRGACVALLMIVELLAEQVEALGGDIPRDALEEAALGALRMPGGAL